MSSPPAPARLAAALSGRYEIERQLGQGGMATVYLAEDVKHRELVFRRGTAVFAVDIGPAAGVVGKERKLFDGGYPPEHGYDVSADGNRFLMVKTVNRPAALPILVITNFFDELRKKTGRYDGPTRGPLATDR